MNKKKIKTKLFTSLSVIIIGLLISASSLSTISIQALIDTNENQNSIDSFDRTEWKWTPTEVVSTESSGASNSPSLAVDDGGNVHISWSDTTVYAGAGTDLDIFYKRWEVSTSAWTTTEVVSTESSDDSYSPSLAVDDGGTVHISWHDYTDYDGAGTDSDIFYKRWEVSTSAWTTTEVVSTESSDDSYSPSLAVDDGSNVHISWSDTTVYAGAGTDLDIFYKRWEVSISSWTTTEVVSTESTGNSYYSSLAIDIAGTVHISWDDYTDYASAGTDSDIFYKRWEVSTSVWTTTEVVSTESSGASNSPSLAVDDGSNVHISWHDYTDYAGAGTDSDIFYKRWEVSTSAWTTTEVVSTESTGNSYSPSLAVDDGGNVHIAWNDQTDNDGAGTDYDIFYKRWEVSISSWTTTEVVSTESSGASNSPSLAVDDEGNVHISWRDLTDYDGAGTDSDIFYKILTGSPATPELAFIVPNPTELTTVYLDWNDVLWATTYNIYRSTSYIWSLEGLVPIISVTSSNYIDTLSSEGFYYYVIVAENLAGISPHSNCQYVEVKFPELDQFTGEWSTTEVVSTESTGQTFDPSLVIDASGNVHIAWHDETDYDGAGTDRDIFYKRWDVSTSTWTTTELVSTESTGPSHDSSIGVDAVGNVHIAWHDWTDYSGSEIDRDIFYKRWDASTSLWTITEVVSTESTTASEYVSLAVDATGNVHIAWTDGTDYDGAGTDRDIFYKRWDIFTSLWTTTEVVSTESTVGSYAPSLAVDATNTVHISWHDGTDYSGSELDQDIFYKRWDASSSLWTITEVVSTESTAASEYVSLAVDAAENVHIAWTDGTDYAGSGADRDIFYKRWDASTSTWTMTEVVSTGGTAGSYYVSLAVDSSGTVHIAWTDQTNYAGSGTDQDIFYRSWDVSTSLWTSTEVVSTESISESMVPLLATDAFGTVHIAWEDLTDYAGAGTGRDIFYKQLICTISAPPELAFIVPNPTEFSTIYLDWNNVLRANTYHVYRSTSYIWSVEGILPVATVYSSDYTDSLATEGFYYYVVVAENLAGNSSHSNCQYVEVKFPDLAAPELAPILPNPTELSSISLVWDSVDGATEYYVYRSTSYIWSVEGLTPIDTVVTTSYIDSLPSEGYYFYVIVASDGIRNSDHSNCEFVEYKLPTLHEFFIISSLIIGLPVFLFVATRIRKKKSKMN